MTEAVDDSVRAALDIVRRNIEQFTLPGRSPEEKARILATAAALGEMLAVVPPSPDRSRETRDPDLLEIAQEHNWPSGAQDVQDAISLLDSSMPGGDKVILETFMGMGWSKTRANNARRLANLYRAELRASEPLPVLADKTEEPSFVAEALPTESLPELDSGTVDPLQLGGSEPSTELTEPENLEPVEDTADIETIDVEESATDEEPVVVEEEAESKEELTYTDIATAWAKHLELPVELKDALIELLNPNAVPSVDDADQSVAELFREILILKDGSMARFEGVETNELAKVWKVFGIGENAQSHKAIMTDIDPLGRRVQQARGRYNRAAAEKTIELTYAGMSKLLESVTQQQEAKKASTGVLQVKFVDGKPTLG